LTLKLTYLSAIILLHLSSLSFLLGSSYSGTSARENGRVLLVDSSNVGGNELDHLIANWADLVVLFAAVFFLSGLLLSAIGLVRREGEELVTEVTLVAASDVPFEVEHNQIFAGRTALWLS
jgi:hypothetical protein